MEPHWLISKQSYYADFFLVPLAILATLLLAGPSWTLVAAALLGWLVWTAIEYFVHRFAFHRLYRREHFAHHKMPARYIGVPWWQTLAAFAAAWGGCVGTAGLAAGAGFWSGLAAGYLAYIAVHDRYHHGQPKTWRPGYLRRMYERHQIHHHGVEANFGVSVPLWDFLLGTHKNPAGGT